jgi:hypothetical protein
VHPFGWGLTIPFLETRGISKGAEGSDA